MNIKQYIKKLMEKDNMSITDEEKELINAFDGFESEMLNRLDEVKNDNYFEPIESNIGAEIAADWVEIRNMRSRGINVLWMYKDFQSEEDCNKWLKEFSDQIIELRPTARERLSFYVKLSTYESTRR